MQTLPQKVTGGYCPNLKTAFLLSLAVLAHIKVEIGLKYSVLGDLFDFQGFLGLLQLGEGCLALKTSIHGLPRR